MSGSVNPPANPNDPGHGPLAPGLTVAAAKALANGVGAAAKVMPVDVNQVLAFLNACTGSQPRVGYGLGAKIANDTSQPGAPAPPGFVAVDCSGFVRAALRRSTTPKTTIPDGSVVQHDWIRTQGFAPGAVADGDLLDGVLRIAFLSPSDSPEHVGHVVLLFDGRTIESHGGKGPDRRVWNTLPWRTKTQVYRLT
jgi:hypothetical protein